MEEADYASSTDSDDEDFVLPDKKEKSDSESMVDEEIDNEHDDGKQIRRKKRKKLQSKETLNKNHESISETIDLEQEKRREEELWAAFLGESEPPKVQSTNDIPIEKKSSIQTSPLPSKTITVGQTKSTVMEENDQEMWQTKESEFKSEDKVIVQEEAEHRISHTKSVSTPGRSSNSKRPISGLSSVLNQISKKNKLSVLQKTKLDWDGFKSTEGINEELQTHNRGKDGFLERRDFLERTDLRQFEIEKNMRQHSRRSQK